MTQISQYTIRTSILVLFLLMLVACEQEEPIRIRVTPTPDTVAQQATTVVDTVFTIEATIVPTVTIPTETEITPSEEVTPSAIPPSATPLQPEGFGPIIDAEYTPPPTSTPAPNSTATVQPSSTPIPITPITTPITELPGFYEDQLGIQLYYNINIDEWFQLLVRTDRLNVGWIKVQANWDFLQPNNRDQFDTAFSLFQSHVQRAHNSGYRVLVSIAKAPDWARPAGADLNLSGPPANPDDLAYFINFMFDRMGDQISAVEVWNEPNLSREWAGGLEWSGAGYMQLFRTSYDTIRARYPQMPIITAGLAPTAAQGAIDDRAFLEQMYNAGLADPYYQNIAVGVHPYGWGNPPDSRCCDNIEGRGWDDDPRFFFLDTLEDYRDIMVSNGHENVQMWATEFGWATWSGLPNEAPDVWMTYNTPEQQADYTIRALEIGRDLDYVGPMFLWNLNFASDDLIVERNEMVGYSLIVPRLPIRPLYDAIANSPRLEPQP